MNASRNPFVRYPEWLFAVFLLGSIPLIWQTTQVSIDTDPLTLLESDQRHQETFDRIQSFLNDDTVVVVSVESDQIFSQAGFDQIRAISNALGQQPGLVDVKSLTHSVKPVRKGLAFAMEPFVPAGQLNDERIETIRQFSVTHPLVRNIMVSPDGKITLITATYKRDFTTPELRKAFRAETEKILQPFGSAEYKIRMISLPFIAEEISESFLRDLWLVLPGTVLVILLIIGLTLRSFPCLVLLLLSEVALMAMLPSALGLADFTLTPYNLLLLPLLGAVNLTMLTHQLTALRKTDATPLAGQSLRRHVARSISAKPVRHHHDCRWPLVAGCKRSIAREGFRHCGSNRCRGYFRMELRARAVVFAAGLSSLAKRYPIGNQ